MQSLNISDIKDCIKPAITGYISIKKNLFWNERYVRMGEGKLSYYEDKTDRTPRAVLQLRGADVQERVNGKPDVFEVRVKQGPIPSLLFRIQQLNFRAKFLKCLYENIKGEVVERDDSFEGIEQQAHNEYPPLPEQYKDSFNSKLVLVDQKWGEMVYSQGSPNNNQPHNKTSIYTRIVQFAVGFVLGCLSIKFQLLFTALAVLVVAIGLRFRKGNKTKCEQVDSGLNRKECLVPVPIDQIFDILQNSRTGLYLGSEPKFIINQQGFYQDKNRFYLVEKDINKVRYLWEFIPKGDKTLVCVSYSSDNPGISLRVFSHLAIRAKPGLGNRGKAGQSATFRQSTMYQNISPSSRRTVPNFSSVVLKQGSVELEKSYNNSLGQQQEYLPSIQRMVQLYPKTPKPIFEQVLASRQMFMSTLNMPYDRTETKNNCVMSVREMTGGLLVTKGVTVMKGNVVQALAYVRDLDKRGEYDGMFNSGKMLQQFEISAVLHQKFNGMFPVAARDFVLLLSAQKIQNGVMLHGKSTNFVSYPPEGKTVRGQVLSAGFQIKNVGNGNIQVIYLTYSNPAGSLPNFVKTKAGGMQSGVILKLRENLQRVFKQ